MKKKFLSLEEKKLLIKEFQNSKLSANAFCIQKKIASSTFHNILKKVSNIATTKTKRTPTKYSEEQKKEAIFNLFNVGTSIKDYAFATKIPKSTIAGWYRSHQLNLSKNKTLLSHEENTNMTKIEAQLNTIINFHNNINILFHKEIMFLERRIVKYFLIVLGLQFVYFILSKCF